MAHEPKLEIYKLKLTKKETGRSINFRDLFRAKFGSYGKSSSETITKKDISTAYFADFVKGIDLKAYNLNKKKKKGFTIAKDTANGKKKSLITPPSDDFIITGILDGGKHGLKRNLGEVDDTEKATLITTNNIVTDRYYFLLYTPLDHNEAILMIQGYTEIRISDVFREHLLSYFKHKTEIISKFEVYIPKSFKEKYLKSAVFKSVKFTSGWAVKADFESNAKSKEYELEVRIEIIDKSKKKSAYKTVTNFVENFGKSLFKLSGASKETKLENFDKRSAKMTSEGRELPLDIDDEDNIKPVILLSDFVQIDEGGVPNFDQINGYCKKVLNDVIKELMPEHAVQEL